MGSRWDVLMMLCLAWCAVVTPFEIGFIDHDLSRGDAEHLTTGLVAGLVLMWMVRSPSHHGMFQKSMA